MSSFTSDQFWAVRLSRKKQVLWEIRTLTEWVISLNMTQRCCILCFDELLHLLVWMLKQLITVLWRFSTGFSDTSEALQIFASWHSFILWKEEYIPVKWPCVHTIPVMSETCVNSLFFSMVGGLRYSFLSSRENSKPAQPENEKDVLSEWKF